MIIAPPEAASSKNQQNFPNSPLETAAQTPQVHRVHVDQFVLHNHKPLDYISFELTDRFLNNSSSFASKQPINFLTYLAYALPSLNSLPNYE